jgi:hypothetical protein
MAHMVILIRRNGNLVSPRSAIAQTSRPERARVVRSTQARIQTKEFTVQENSPFDKPLEHSTSLKFAQMTRRQKYVFVAKLVACIATFGYAFPNVQND